MTYVNRYLQKKCSCDLQSLFSQSRNPEKEISESYAAYSHIKSFLPKDTSNEVFLCIGDGSLGMTGSLLSFVTKGFSIVVDPLLRMDKLLSWKNERNVNRLMLFKNKFQDVNQKDVEDFLYDGELIIILVHSHVDTSEVLKKFPYWKYCYVNPCCKPNSQKLSIEFQKQNNISTVLAGIDTNILSDKNEVFVYKNNRES